MRSFARFAVLWLCWAAVGCGNKSQTQATSPETLRSDKLLDIGEAYTVYVKANGHAPADTKEWAKVEITNPLGYAAVNSGECVLLFGGTAGADPNTVLAYEKDVPTAGGKALMQNGQVKDMTAAEFAAAPKAGKK